MQLQKKQSAPFFSQCSDLLPEERRRVYFGRVSELPQELLRATLAGSSELLEELLGATLEGSSKLFEKLLGSYFGRFSRATRGASQKLLW